MRIIYITKCIECPYHIIKSNDEWVCIYGNLYSTLQGTPDVEPLWFCKLEKA